MHTDSATPLEKTFSFVDLKPEDQAFFVLLMMRIVRIVLQRVEQRGWGEVPKAAKEQSLSQKQARRVGRPAGDSIYASLTKQLRKSQGETSSETKATPPQPEKLPNESLVIRPFNITGPGRTPANRMDSTRGTVESPTNRAAAQQLFTRIPSVEPAADPKPLLDHADAEISMLEIAHDKKEKISSIVKFHINGQSITKGNEVAELVKFLGIHAKNPPSDQEGFPAASAERLDQLKKLVFVESLLRGKNGVFGEDYSWDKIEEIGGSHIHVVGGAGHGDVLLVNETPYVVKRNLNASETKAYDPANSEGSKPSYAFGKAGGDGIGTFVIMQNAGYDAKGRKLCDQLTMRDDGKPFHTNIFDIKMGHGWASRKESLIQGKYTSGFKEDVKFFFKRIRNNIMRLAGGKRKYGIISRDPIYFGGKAISGVEFPNFLKAIRIPFTKVRPFKVLNEFLNSVLNYKNTDKILTANLERMSQEQARAYLAQLNGQIENANNADRVFVASSLMNVFVAKDDKFTDEESKNPNVLHIDFGHSFQKKDIKFNGEGNILSADGKESFSPEEFKVDLEEMGLTSESLKTDHIGRDDARDQVVSQIFDKKKRDYVDAFKSLRNFARDVLAPKFAGQ